jgi:hypothetical protein
MHHIHDIPRPIMFAERTLGIKEMLDHWLREIGFHDFRTEEQEFVDRLLNSSIVPSLCDGNGSVERKGFHWLGGWI